MGADTTRAAVAFIHRNGCINATKCAHRTKRKRQFTLVKVWCRNATATAVLKRCPSRCCHAQQPTGIATSPEKILHQRQFALDLVGCNAVARKKRRERRTQALGDHAIHMRCACERHTCRA